MTTTPPTGAQTAPETIQVTVRLRSILRHRDGEIVNQLLLELPLGSNVGDARVAANIPAHFEVVLVVNDELVEEDAVLHDGDRLMVLPMVAGGISQKNSDSGDHGHRSLD